MNHHIIHLLYGRKKILHSTLPERGEEEEKKNSVGTAAGQDWEDFEGQNQRITH